MTLTLLLKHCQTHRDRAAILFLLDTGVRNAEFAAIVGADLDVKAGLARVRSGKGGKGRTVFFGAKTQKATGAVLSGAPARARCPCLWVDFRGVAHVAKAAGQAGGREARAIRTRSGARVLLWCLRAGMDVHRLARLLGHADIAILRQYLDLVDDDVRAAHAAFGAVDNFLK
jgi:integrase/recombinase XerD